MGHPAPSSSGLPVKITGWICFEQGQTETEKMRFFWGQLRVWSYRHTTYIENGALIEDSENPDLNLALAFKFEFYYIHTLCFFGCKQNFEG
jgi:hypothetical protein